MRPKIVTDLRCGRVNRKTSLDLPLLGTIYWAFLQFSYVGEILFCLLSQSINTKSSGRAARHPSVEIERKNTVLGFPIEDEILVLVNH